MNFIFAALAPGFAKLSAMRRGVLNVHESFFSAFPVVPVDADDTSEIVDQPSLLSPGFTATVLYRGNADNKY